MRKQAIRLATLAAVGAFSFGAMGTAWAGDPEPRAKCNSGRGNGSETAPENDCDPGKSGLKNNGGD